MHQLRLMRPVSTFRSHSPRQRLLHRRDFATKVQQYLGPEIRTVDYHLKVPLKSEGTVTGMTGEHGDAGPRQPGITTGLAGLDRRAMERERLARQAMRTGKRERSISPPPRARPAKLARLVDGVESATGQHTPDIASAVEEPPKLAVPQGSTGNSSQPPLQPLKYPHGKLLKTWAFRHQRVPDQDIKFEEVIERRSLRTAVVSAFQFDFEWFFTKLDTKGTNMELILHAKQPDYRAHIKKDLESLGPNVKVCLPRMDGGAFCMHSKLMLLFHPDKLRVVIPSANVVPYDWGETGTMENSVWLIDLPRLSGDEGTKAKVLETSFLSELRYFLRKQDVSSQAIDGLNNFDWSNTAPYAFVASVGSTLYGPDVAHSGMTALTTAVQRLGLATAEASVDMCASSVGALNVDFLSSFYAACIGSLPTSTVGNPQLTPPTSCRDAVRSSFHLYFPTHDYVAQSTGGTSNGGTIWFSREHYDRPTFPKQIFREYQSVRPGMLSHNKIVFVRGLTAASPKVPAHPTSSKKADFFGKKASATAALSAQESAKDSTAARQVAWLYHGSANCSESAWGTAGIVKKAGPQKGMAKIYCRNWECGILIPVLDDKEQPGAPANGDDALPGVKENGARDEVARDADETESEDEDDLDVRSIPAAKGTTSVAAKQVPAESPQQVPPWDVFKDTIHGPFKYPAPPFGSQEPWYVKEHLHDGAAPANSAEG